MRGVFDLEGNGLLDHTTINYLTAPFTLKPTFRLWCAVIVDVDTGETFRYAGEPELRKPFIEKMQTLTTIIGHNVIDFDLLVLKLYLDIEYTIDEQCTFMGKNVEIIDTLVLSKVLNPDRYGGHSLDEWGKRLGIEKIDWRAKAIELGLITAGSPKGAEFAQYHPEMLVYNERDCHVNVKLYHYLVQEMGDHPWQDAFTLEQMVRDIITRQGHRGFFFNSELAGENIRDLDQKMESIRQIVEPLLPPKPMGKTKVKEFLPPKIQFKKNGEVSAVMLKWVEKHGGWIKQMDDGSCIAHIFNVEWKLPMAQDIAVKTHEPATVKDTTHIKGWLVELGWKPTQYKERDLTCDTKKQKLSEEKFRETVERYVAQTLSSPFCRDRCDELDTPPARLLQRLLKHDPKRPLKVYTNPTLTVGMEKEIDPAILELAGEFPHAKLVSEYLTYSHRRNSILGGGIDPDDWDDRDEEDEYAGKGFLAAERIQEDGRIQTPADTCGASSSRFKHRLVANIPRVSSLYGGRMRGMFGVDVDDGFFQLGYDFNSLEAMIEAHYVYKYEGGLEYGLSLTAEKPNDCHSVLARKIGELLGRIFNRNPAKNVKYGCAYGAMPARIAKTIGCSLEDGKVIWKAFWDNAASLGELKIAMEDYWETTGNKKFIPAIDKRKLPIRSKSNLINSAFQSAGVICAKRAMVIHEQLLREEGLIVDFFRDNWKERDFCQQLIAYHDEAQLEIRRSQVTWKKFADEAECKAFISEDGKVWSEPVHNEKGWFRGYCRAGELATIAVRMSGEYYKLNVPLSAGYAIGRSWAECH